jgi:hypothetical protein
VESIQGIVGSHVEKDFGWICSFSAKNECDSLSIVSSSSLAKEYLRALLLEKREAMNDIAIMERLLFFPPKTEGKLS